MLIGSIVNGLAVVAGSFAGLAMAAPAGKFSKQGSDRSRSLGPRIQTIVIIVMQGLALCVLYIGITGCLSGQNGLITILSMVFGTILGELLDLDLRMKQLGDWIQRKVARRMKPGATTSISEGFVTASLLYCVGAMGIVGAMQDGLVADHSTLFAKAILDGTSSILFAASLGIGVVFSAIAVFVYQGSISILASFLQPLLTDVVIGEMTCVGSLLILALGLNMLDLTKIKVMNMVPAIFMPILLCLWL